MVNHLEGSADNFIGGELWSTNIPVSVYSAADSTRFVYSIPKNSFVGKIYSYIVKDGKVWWQIDNKNLNRFVLHESGIFDAKKLQDSLDKIRAQREKEIEDKVQERKDKGGFEFFNFLKNILGDLDDIAKYAIPILILIIVLKTLK